MLTDQKTVRIMVAPHVQKRLMQWFPLLLNYAVCILVDVWCGWKRGSVLRLGPGREPSMQCVSSQQGSSQRPDSFLTLYRNTIRLVEWGWGGGGGGCWLNGHVVSVVLQWFNLKIALNVRALNGQREIYAVLEYMNKKKKIFEHISVKLEIYIYLCDNDLLFFLKQQWFPIWVQMTVKWCKKKWNVMFKLIYTWCFTEAEMVQEMV